MRLKSAFTMIELVFVIVVLGILAGVAIPKLVVTRDDATVSKLRADIAAIRSGIALQRQQNLMSGNPNWPDLNATANPGFDNILQSKIRFVDKGSRNGWIKTANNNEFEVCVAGSCTKFTYYPNLTGLPAGVTRGSFVCKQADSACQMLSE
ncbi:type II secretion system protein [Campylobacter geochelonis]|uniref:type II secretion system protein n=1 Tax=Campylobacter geochelonis TaxID=1780362 RepID=UPI0007709999|nr:prepilin-type N-terminal cleavage/methylation domain-containing protein [Campylobacter geochelonis]CZE49412.1 N-methylation [Campylobacter geochelonis]CZE51496.1 N-methylation [Campylobacter geochelonis]